MFVRHIADASTLSRDPLREGSWTRRFVIVWLALLVFRLVFLALSPLDLSGDESYYWEWGRRLDWGYFSKPPLIGWLMAFFGWIGDHTTFGLRLGATVFTAGSLGLIFLLGRAMFSAEAGFWSALAIGFTPGNAALSFLFTIDAPLLFCWCLALLAAWCLIGDQRWSWGYGLLLAGALGGGLLSKQMMLVFPLLLLLYLALEPRHRHWLAEGRLWLCLGLGLLCLIPPLWWNVQHDWITFSHTTGTNLASPSVSLAKRFGRFGEFIGAQLVLLTPVTYVLMLWLLGRAVRSWGRLQPAERFLWVFAAPTLLLFFALALRQRALPNWPAAFYPAAAILLGGWVARNLSFASMAKAGARVFRVGFAVALLLTLGLHSAAVLVPSSGLEIGEKAPLRRLDGWREYGEAVAAVARREFGDAAHSYLVAGHRYYASELAFYHPEQPRVYRWTERDHPESQYELWPQFATATEPQTLIVIPGGIAALPPGLPDQFRSWTLLEEIEIPLSTHDARTFALFRGTSTSAPK